MSVEPPITVADPPARPLLVWDGACGFCKLWVTRWRTHVAHAVDTAPAQEVGERFPEIPPGHFQRAVQLIEPNGEVTEGAHAVFRAFALGGHPAVLRAYQRLPGFANATNAVYGFVARHRVFVSKWTRFFFGRDPSASTYRIARSLLVRGLGLVLLAAFVSVWMQVDGLIGERGIEPAGTFLQAIGQMANEQGIGADRYRLVPTLFWLGASNHALHLACGAGVVAALFLLADFVAPLALVVAWASYLSLVTVGNVFFGYQWDALLLESLVAGLFVARLHLPWKKPAANKRDPDFGIVVPRVVFFKLMVMSGIVKLASHDAAWSNGRALLYHFWTQPLPTRFAWMAHALPEPVRMTATFVTLGIELVFPVLIFAPRPWRRAAFLAFLLLQLGIMVTGSYGFFNLLTVVLSLSMLDDAAFARVKPLRSRVEKLLAQIQSLEITPPVHRTRVRITMTLLGLALIVTPAAPVLFPPPWVSLADYAAPLRSFNTYGLFAMMTTERPEITLEGSDDGQTWQPYIFRYKPGPLGRAPRWTGLHMPRLDWQMWFASLNGDCRREHWYIDLLRRLFDGSPDVRALFESVPFEGRPPRLIRSTLSLYRFSTSDERAQTGELWVREAARPFCPTVKREDLP